MLFNPKWNKEPSISGFKAWLEQQPRGRTFHYVDCYHCPVGTYLRSCGTNWHEMSGRNGNLLRDLNSFADFAARNTGSWTITAAVVLAEMAASGVEEAQEVLA